MSSGRLTKEDLRELAREHVELQLYNTEAQSQPRALILAGQSGAGKSTVASDLKAELDVQGGYISVDADEMRTRLPYFDELDGTDLKVAATTQADAGALAQAVRHEAMQARRNIVVDGTLRDSDSAFALAKDLRAAGYRVELHALAVNEQISFERATGRYEEKRTRGDDFARYVPRDWHDRSYAGVVDSVKRLEYSAAVDEISVYNRLGDRIHNAAPEAGQTLAAATLVTARQQLTSYERINLAQHWDEIAESMDKREANDNERANAQLSMERAHYTLRSAPDAAQQYDHDNPPERFRSAELAEAYGQRLEQAFQARALDQAKDLPELANAFMASEAVARYEREHPQFPPGSLANRVNERIADDLRSGHAIKPIAIRGENVAHEVPEALLDR